MKKENLRRPPALRARATTRVWPLFLMFLLPVFAMAAAPEFRVESLPVTGGSELITIFGRVPDASASTAPEEPLMSVLRDGLGSGDRAAHRLRYLWVLTSMQPGLLQRAEAAVPFFYWRAGFAGNPDRVPAPVLDLSAPARQVWHAGASWLAQLLAFDPSGVAIRSSTRSYRNNSGDAGTLHATEGVAILSEIQNDPAVKGVLSEEELLEINIRLSLNSQMLGGLVDQEQLPTAYIQQRTKTEETRGHNWELLRQRAETNGLYFEPFGIDGSGTHAILWIATEDIGSLRKFDGQFLGISDPFRDTRLANWKGYREVRDGKEMIPLALYALDYPKVPLLLVDFRNVHAPKRREMIRHGITDLVSGVLGISKFGDWPYLAGSTAFEYVRIRHGATNNRPARLKAYAEVREWLALDRSIDSGLRRELQQKLEIMGVNPMEQSIMRSPDVARRQYVALVRYATDPKGLPARIEKDRDRELVADRHGAAARAGYTLASIFSFGIYSHQEKETGEELRARLSDERRVASEKRFLKEVAASGPQAEVVWNMAEVQRAVNDIGAQGLPSGSTQVVRNILRETRDQETREICDQVLQEKDAALGGGQ